MKWILIFLLICACSNGSKNEIQTENVFVEVIMVDSKETIIHKDKKYIIYGKVFRVGNSYSSHVVWSVDSSGNIIDLSTR